MSMELERRFIKGLEVRKSADKVTLVGTAVPYDSPSEDLGFIEIIQKGAFERHLRTGADVRALVEHDPARMLARTRSGTMVLTDDVRGVHFSIDIPNTTLGADVAESVKRGDVDGMSFAFRTVADSWATENGKPKRAIIEAELYEVSLTGTPAYSGTTVALRSLEQFKKETSKMEPTTEPTPDVTPADPKPEPERRTAPIATGGADGPIEWRNTRENREVRVLKPNQRFADLHKPGNDGPLSLGRAIRALIVGDWRHAEAEQRALSTVSNSAGGILAPDRLAASVIDLARAKSVLAWAGAQTVSMDSSTLTIARVSVDPTMETKAENASFTGSDVTFDGITFTANTIGTVVKMSRELAADAPNSVQIIEDTIARKLAERLDYYGLRGSGSGQPSGLLTFSGTNTEAVGGAVGWDNILDAIKECEADNFDPGTLIVSPARINNLRQLKVNSEANHYAAPPAAALALQVLVASSCPDTAAVVGDFSEFLIGLRQSPLIEVTTEGGSAFEAHQVYVKVTWRGDFNTAHREAFCLLTGIS